MPAMRSASLGERLVGGGGALPRASEFGGFAAAAPGGGAATAGSGCEAEAAGCEVQRADDWRRAAWALGLRKMHCVKMQCMQSV